MAEGKAPKRLSKAAKEFNIGIQTIVEFLDKKGIEINANPNTKLSHSEYELLVKEFESDKSVKEESMKIGLEFKGKHSISIEDEQTQSSVEEDESPTDELFIKKTQLEYNHPTSTNEKKEYVKAEDTTREDSESKASSPLSPAMEKAEIRDAEQQNPKAVEPEKEPSTPEPLEVQSPKKPKTEVDKAVVNEDKSSEEVKKPLDVVESVSSEEIQQVEKVEQSASTEKSIEEKEIEIEPIEESGTPLHVLGKIDLDALNLKTKPARKSKDEKKKERDEKKAQREAEKKAMADKLKKEQDKQKKTKEEATKKEARVHKKAPDAHPSDSRPAHPDKTAKKRATGTNANNTHTASHEKTDDQVRIANNKTVPDKSTSDKKEDNFIPTHVERLSGPTILGTIELPVEKKHEKKPVASSSDDPNKKKKKKRKRIKKPVTPAQQDKDKQATGAANKGTHNVGGQSKGPQQNRHKNKPVVKPRQAPRHEPTEEEIQKQIKDTLQRLSGSGKSKTSKHRRDKRADRSKQRIKEQQRIEQENLVLKVTEFVTVNELANMMSVPVTNVIGTCMSLGLFVSINQRLDAETLTLVADEFGYDIEFVSVDVQEAIKQEEDTPENLVSRHPIVTVMGHVDHGKTSLLDYIRHANVIAGEAGGITQHIGAYEVIMKDGKKITFLDTPGHEAFTAMRARGAKVTDVAIIIIAADDHIMPQTIEAINHAQAAGVPIVFALNKIDKPGADANKLREELANRNILVEDWGGKYQVQEISAKKGIGIPELLEKVLLEAEMLDLKANPSRLATGTIIESSLDKGRGYVAKLLVENGTLNIGDMVLAGAYFGKVKAMYNERNLSVNEAGPATPLLLLGLNGAPQAGDNFNVMEDEREVKSIAAKRSQLQREQGFRSQKHVTLDEIGRRIAVGDFKELNIIVKGDVDGSVEALSDSLLKLSNEEVQVNVIHKSVGAVTESDVLLASASDAIIVAFQVRPSIQARRLAEQEQIDIRLYSIIYQAIEEIKSAIEGMLSPDIEEKIVCNIEVREVFKITKVGTVAGCMVLDGKVHRNTRIRLIRDGIVIYSGNLGSLKRFKDDVKEVATGYECGLNIDNFNDIKEGDIIEGYEEVEVKRKLK